MEIYFFICLRLVLVNQELVHIYSLYNKIQFTQRRHYSGLEATPK